MEIYRNELTPITVTLPTGAVVTSVTATRAGENIAGVTNVANVVTLPYAQYQLDGEIKITVQFTISAQTGSIDEYVNVVTPIIPKATADAIVEDRYADLEPLVRHVISAYTGQSFGKWSGAYTLEGNGGILGLPERLLSLTDMVSRGVTYSSSLFDIKGDGWFLGYKSSIGLDIGEAITYPEFDDLGVIYAPPLNWTAREFNDNVFYTVTGVFGWNYVPQKVLEAAKILYSDYACNDALYRDRYLKSIRSADWRLEFNAGAWQGTGNVKADWLLDEYRRGGMVVI